MERRGDTDPGRLADGVEVRVAQHPGHGRAEDEPDQHGDGGHEPAEERWIATITASVPSA